MEGVNFISDAETLTENKQNVQNCSDSVFLLLDDGKYDRSLNEVGVVKSGNGEDFIYLQNQSNNKHQ